MSSGDRSTSKKQHREATIEKIRTSAVLNRLIKHAMGEVEMSSSQVAAAKALINKYIPDVSSVEMTAEVEHSVAASEPMTTEQWLKESAGHLSQDHKPH